MNCLQAEEHFSAYLEDTLDYQTLQRFEQHVAECEVCQHEYARFQESVKAVQELPQIEPSPYFMSTLQQRLAIAQGEPGSVRAIAATGWKQLLAVLRRPKWAFSGIIALILAVAGTYFYQESSLFDRDLRSAPVTHTLEEITTPPETLRRIGPPRFVRDNSQFLPSDIISTPAQPMQQRYMLKQVSYTAASTSGGL